MSNGLIRNNEETKKSLSKIIGIPCEQLAKMSEDEIQEYVKKNTGKQIPSKSTMFREMMKVRKEEKTTNLGKSAKKLPVHKRILAEKQGEAR